MKRADAIWNKGPDLIDDDGEVRELTVEDFKNSVPFSELPESLQFKLKEIQRGNVVVRPDPVKKTVSLALSSDVLEKFEAKGEGWESKVDEALREWLEEHKAS
jgi:uncharacterized protein (DUF4415 family)